VPRGERLVPRRPRYLVIAEDLRRQVLVGRLGPGARLPSEAALCAAYGASRGTVRQALELLRREGMIRRVPGAGTHVEPAPEPGRRGPLVGAILATLHGFFTLELLEGIRAAAEEQGARVVAAATGGRPGMEAETVRRLAAEGVRAFVLEPSPGAHTSPAFWTRCRAEGLRVVQVDRRAPLAPWPWVASDNRAGGRLLGRHLLAQGCRRFFLLRPPEFPTSSALDRFAGIRDALVEAGLSPEDAVEGTLQDLARCWREEARVPDAVVGANDGVAAEALALLAIQGIAVPDDVCVTGFDDLPFARLLQPPLTSVWQDRAALGRRAAELALAWLRGERVAEAVVWPVALRPRASSLRASRVRRTGAAP
jgi:DNA-binding LacI/PurR family transcriptional regulator